METCELAEPEDGACKEGSSHLVGLGQAQAARCRLTSIRNRGPNEALVWVVGVSSPTRKLYSGKHFDVILRIGARTGIWPSKLSLDALTDTWTQSTWPRSRHF